MKTGKLFMFIALVLLMPALVFAQDQQQAQAQQQKVADPYVAITSFAGQALTNNAGEQIGTLQDAFLTSDGQVSFLVASLQDAPGIPNGTYVIPVSDFEMAEGQVHLNVSAGASYQQAEGAKNAGVVAMDSVRASELLQYQLVSDQGQALGSIQDVVLNMQNGQVEYAAVSFDAILGAGDKMFAVPYADIWYNLNDQTVTLYNVNPQVLEQKEGFSQDNWPETGDPNWNTAS